MTDIVETNQDVTPEAHEATNQPQSSKYEQQALDLGWRPQEEWTGDPEDFVDAKEFVQRKSFFDRISTQSAEIKELKKTLNEFSDHFRKVEDYTRKQVLEELRAAKKNALEEGNADEVLRIDEAIIDFKTHEKEMERQKAEKEAKGAQPTGELNPSFVQWQQRNSWYTQDPEMTRFADTYARGVVAANPDADRLEILADVEREVKARFSDKFKNRNRTAPAAVEGSTGGAKPKTTKLDATPEELAAARRFVKIGAYKSEQEYIAALRKLGD